MVGFSGGKALVYKSDTIIERRGRILREARKLISRSGHANFSVRELCERAGIAQKTLYNAFGSRENVIALAIREYLAAFNEHAVYRFDPASLEGRLERLVKVHSRNLQIRPYTTAIMAVYNSPTAGPAIRDAIRDVSQISMRPYALALERDRAFAPGVTAAAFTRLTSTMVYAVLTDWCLGEISGEQLVERVSEAFLVVLIGCTKGPTRTNASRWLRDLRGRRPNWIALRKAAEVPPPGGPDIDRHPAAEAAEAASDPGTDGHDASR